MGAIHELPLNRLANTLRQAASLKDFVETGTYLGNSLAWASENFQHVWTIEIDPGYLDAARARHAGLTNIHYVMGDSAAQLSKVLGQIEGPALCWLDAHAGAGFFAPEDNCPLLEELKAVIHSPYEHCILIDDARAFVAPPPPPFNYRKWAPLEEIFAALALKPNYHVVIIEDALIAVPRRFRDLVAEFCFSIRPNI
jgi:hypothetical protein